MSILDQFWQYAKVGLLRFMISSNFVGWSDWSFCRAISFV